MPEFKALPMLTCHSSHSWPAAVARTPARCAAPAVPRSSSPQGHASCMLSTSCWSPLPAWSWCHLPWRCKCVIMWVFPRPSGYYTVIPFCHPSLLSHVVALCFPRASLLSLSWTYECTWTGKSVLLSSCHLYSLAASLPAIVKAYICHRWTRLGFHYLLIKLHLLPQLFIKW